MNYQDLQLLQASLCVAALFVLCVRAILVREEKRPRLFWLGALIGVIAAVAFWVVSIVVIRQPSQSELRLEMATRFLREVPALLIVAYGCFVQASWYTGVRNRRLLSAWFGKAPLLLLSTFLFAALVGILDPFPILGLNESLPPQALAIDAVWMVPLGSFSSISAFVFFEAIGQRMPDLRQRLQNFSAALGIICVSVIVWITLFTTLVRATGMSAWLARNVQTVEDLQTVLIGTAALGFAVAVVSYGTRDRCVVATERFLRSIEVVGEISEVIENAPISGTGLSVEYASLLEAAGEEFLDLSDIDLRKLDSSFRISLIWASRAHPGLASRLLHLTQVYGEEFAGQQKYGADPGREFKAFYGAADFRGADPLETYEVLKLTLLMLKGGEGWETLDTIGESPIWMQMCSVALADGAVLDPSRRKKILEGSVVPRKVLDAYWLAKRKVSTVRIYSGPSMSPRWSSGKKR